MTRDPDDRDDLDGERRPGEGTDDDALWRSIVENYGERVLGDPAAEAEPDTTADPTADDAAPAPGDPARLRRMFRPLVPEDDGAPAELDEDPYDRFVPPDPPPLPRPTPDRLLAWIGVFGAPAVLLVCVVAQVALPRLVAWTLAGWFLIGFGYLVATMSSEPRDPWDDGAAL